MNYIQLKKSFQMKIVLIQRKLNMIQKDYGQYRIQSLLNCLLVRLKFLKRQD